MVPNEDWLRTILHTLGHHDEGCDVDKPPSYESEGSKFICQKQFKDGRQNYVWHVRFVGSAEYQMS